MKLKELPAMTPEKEKVIFLVKFLLSVDDPGKQTVFS